MRGTDVELLSLDGEKEACNRLSVMVSFTNKQPSAEEQSQAWEQALGPRNWLSNRKLSLDWDNDLQTADKWTICVHMITSLVSSSRPLLSIVMEKDDNKHNVYFCLCKC